MPKKTRRMKERAAMRRTIAPQANASEATGEGEVPEISQAPSIRMRPTLANVRSSLQDYDYSHIYGDLRRIALFAGLFFAILIVLSFVIK